MLRLASRKTCVRRVRARGAFTLLEVILALGIGVVLLGALYYTMNLQVRDAQTGRNAIQRANLARTLFSKISADINGHIGPVSPWLQQKLASGSSVGGSSPSANTSNTNNSTSTNASGNTQMAQPSSTGETPPAFMINGDGQSLKVALSRYPREVKQGQLVSDLRLVYYWLVSDGTTTGLARREVVMVTASDPNVDPTTLPDQDKYVIAPAVRDMLLEYWGGSDSGWLATWDGTSPGADGSTPQGPPAAIRITLKMVVRPARGDQPELVQEFQHVVGIPTANIVQPAGTTGQ